MPLKQKPKLKSKQYVEGIQKEKLISEGNIVM